MQSVHQKPPKQHRITSVDNNDTFTYLGLLEDSGMIHGQFTGHTLYKISTADGNQRKATSKHLQLPYRCYDIITAINTKHS